MSRVSSRSSAQTIKWNSSFLLLSLSTLPLRVLLDPRGRRHTNNAKAGDFVPGVPVEKDTFLCSFGECGQSSPFQGRCMGFKDYAKMVNVSSPIVAPFPLTRFRRNQSPVPLNSSNPSFPFSLSFHLPTYLSVYLLFIIYCTLFLCILLFLLQHPLYLLFVFLLKTWCVRTWID